MSTPILRPALEVQGRRWFLLVLGALIAALSVQYSHKALSQRSAIMRWQPQILELEEGVDISARHNYGNPPIMAVMLLPLLKLPPLAAALIWFYLKVGMAVLSMFWIFRLIDPDRPFPLWAQCGAVLLSIRPILGDLQHGNVNLLIVFLVVAALTAHRWRHDVLAGLLLALSIACKLTPALFLPYFVWKRSWRVVAGSAAGLILFFWPGVVPAMVLGVEENQMQFVSWYEFMVRPFVVEGKVWSEHNNQSLVGLSYRMLTNSPSFSHYDGPVYVADRWDNFFDLDRDIVRWGLKGCMAVFALVVVWCCRTPTRPASGWRLATEWALIVLGMLLFSERTWKHHCVTLMLPFTVLCYYLAVCNPTPRLRYFLIGTLVAVVLLMESTSTTLFGAEVAKMAQTYGAYVWANLLLIVALVAMMRSKGSPAATLEPDGNALRRWRQDGGHSTQITRLPTTIAKTDHEA
jgi:hypothetical protein